MSGTNKNLLFHPVEDQPIPSLEQITILERLSPNCWKAIDDRPSKRDATGRPPTIVLKRSSVQSEQEVETGGRILIHPTPGDILNESIAIIAVQAYYAAHVAKEQGATTSRVITVHDMWETSDAVYLATPFIDAKNLFESRLPVLGSMAVTYAIQMLDTLGLVHKAGFMHYDVKVANWMNVSSFSNPSLTLIDFSLARPKAQKGFYPGTLGYTSPTILEREHDPRADVFAVGVNLYYLLTGKFPFENFPDSSLDEHTWRGRYARRIRAKIDGWSKSNPLQKEIARGSWFLPKQVAPALLAMFQEERPSLFESRNNLARAIGEPELKYSQWMEKPQTE